MVDFAKRFPAGGHRDIEKVIANEDDINSLLFSGDTYLGSTIRPVRKDQKGIFQCRGKRYGGYRFSQCYNKGKYEEAGYWWCGHHAPTRVLRRHVTRHWNYEDKWKARTERVEASEKRQEAREKVLQTARDCLNQKASYDDLMIVTERLVVLEEKRDAQKSS